jgi:hypothetical protein
MRHIQLFESFMESQGSNGQRMRTSKDEFIMENRRRLPRDPFIVYLQNVIENGYETFTEDLFTRLNGLLNSNSDKLNLQDETGGTILHTIAKDVTDLDYEYDEEMDSYAFGIIKIVKMLLKYGADPNIQDDEGRTPCHYTVDYTRNALCCEFTRTLVDSGANTKIKDNDGQTLSTLLDNTMEDQYTIDRAEAEYGDYDFFHNPSFDWKYGSSAHYSDPESLGSAFANKDYERRY